MNKIVVYDNDNYITANLIKFIDSWKWKSEEVEMEFLISSIEQIYMLQ